MDYIHQPFLFQMRKAARYVRLYGPRRTFVKVQSQYHMYGGHRRSVKLGPGVRADAHVGLIGCGNFAYTTIAYFLCRNAGRVIRGAMDLNQPRAASLARRYGAHYGTDEPERLIEDPAIDLVYIASNHASHAEYAISALEAGKHVHIEKPHVVSESQLVRLCRAMQLSPARVSLGFNRPDSRLGSQVRRLLDQQQGTMMLNWFIAGHELPAGHWYFDEAEGGRVLGNLCHWTDFVLRAVPAAARFPIGVHPTRAAQSDADISVSYVFGDGSIATITFSAKGHAFEGVKEHLSAHRGDLILALDDFQQLRANVAAKRQKVTLRFRDHGHESGIMRSYGMSARAGSTTAGSPPDYVWETGQLFLATRRALDERRALTVDAFDPAVVGRRSPARAAAGTTL